MVRKISMCADGSSTGDIGSPTMAGHFYAAPSHDDESHDFVVEQSSTEDINTAAYYAPPVAKIRRQQINVIDHYPSQPMPVVAGGGFHQAGGRCDSGPPYDTSPYADTEASEILKHWISGAYDTDDYFSPNGMDASPFSAGRLHCDGLAPRTLSESHVYTQQSAPSVPKCSPAGRSCSSGFSDSPSGTSYSTSISSEIDDSIILDEILSMEEEQQRRRATMSQQKLSCATRNGHNELSSPRRLASGEISSNSILTTTAADNVNLLTTPGCYVEEQSPTDLTEIQPPRPVKTITTCSSNISTTASCNTTTKSSSAPPDSPPAELDQAAEEVDDCCEEKDEPVKEQHVGMRDRRKKDVHNMIERRRRYNINDKIRELGSLLPKSRTQELKMNKGSILRASVEYFRVVNFNQERMYDMGRKQQILELENKKMARRIQELEQELKLHGIQIPQGSSDDTDVATNNAQVHSSSDSAIAASPASAYLRIKSEPTDDEQQTSRIQSSPMSSNAALGHHQQQANFVRRTAADLKHFLNAHHQSPIKRPVSTLAGRISNGVNGASSSFSSSSSSSNGEVGGRSSVPGTLCCTSPPSKYVVSNGAAGNYGPTAAAYSSSLSGQRHVVAIASARSILNNRRHTDSSVVRDLLLSQATTANRLDHPCSSSSKSNSVCGTPLLPCYNSSLDDTTKSATPFPGYLLDDYFPMAVDSNKSDAKICSTTATTTTTFKANNNSTGSNSSNSNSNNNNSGEFCSNIGGLADCFSIVASLAAANNGNESYAPSPVDLSDFDWCSDAAINGGCDSTSSTLGASLFADMAACNDQSDFILA